MTDLGERLRQIERNLSPDLWEEITSRAMEPARGEGLNLRRRVTAGLVAVVVSIAGLALLVAVFRPGDERAPVNGQGQITLLVSSSGPSGDQASLTGTLTTRDGCVAVSAGHGSSVFVVWPRGYSLAAEAEADWLVDDSGTRIAAIGDEVHVPGGITDLAHAEVSVPGGIPSSCQVAGPDAYWLAGTPGVVRPSPSPSRTSPVYFPLVFPISLDGWTVRNFDAVEEGTATKAWAATVPIDDRDLAPRGAAIPVRTIENLPPGEAVIVALATPWHLDPSAGPWPPGSLDPLRLSEATIRGPEAEEPPGDYTIFDVQNGYTSVRVFFRGTATDAAVEAAQDQLATLEVPPTCPIGEEASVAPAESEPGAIVTLSGPMPIQFEDGSYDVEGGTIAIAWWNVHVNDWPYLSSFSTRSPSPAETGPILRLGEGGRGQCSFSITFTVPEVPPGDYPIVVIHEGPLPNPDGAALTAALVLHVR